ncbi:L-ascorbate oxidase [Venturia nashicola]|uniref:L-ascorbate oxidase n=1 Tax=Venturia nashicola TaxID=86259 RepID=A0A4Z1P7C9_9PEZI|nr:L-ascorbate oxidase [Venturia nashicola]TLD25889.1 L-ascorbate oxidase [Venturia nashicola]
MRLFHSFAVSFQVLSYIFAAGAFARLAQHGARFEPDYILRATAKNITSDCESHYAVVLNGTSPGPPIYLREGWTTWIRVYNDIPDQNLTVHWHGLAMRSAPFSDGTALVAQWPVSTDNFFDYEIHPEIGDAGTYFYHSHVGFQAISAAGPLIVEECGPPPYQYDENIVLQIGDYYNKSNHEIEEGLQANPFKWSGEVNALLVNGHSGKKSLSAAPDPSCAPLVIKVKPSTTYRLRVIGGTAISLVKMGIEGHSNLTLIEADGYYSKPFETDHIQVASGQRFSAIFKTKSAAELKELNRTSFFVRYENRERPGSASGYAILAYDVEGAELPQTLPATSPVKLPKETYNWVESALQPYNASFIPFPRKSTRTVIIQMNQVGNLVNGTWKSKLEWAQNGLPWKESTPQIPYLVDIYKRGQAAIPDYKAAVAGEGYDPKTAVFPAKLGEVIDIVWQSNSGASGSYDFHPLHGHGPHVWDLGSGNGTYNATEMEQRLEGFEPMRRDTTMLYRYLEKGAPRTTLGYRVWRVRVDDPGIWMMHCHILQHMIMGMQSVWSFGDAADILERFPRPYVSGYLEFGGDAYGNSTFDPVVNKYFPDNAKEKAATCRNWDGGSRKANKLYHYR